MLNDILQPSSAPSSLNLLDLPPEVLVIIISKLSPVPLSRLSQSCRALHIYVKSLGDILWKDIFLALWDDPAAADEAIMAIRAPEFCVSFINSDDDDTSSIFGAKCEGKRPCSEGITFRWREEVQRRTETEIFLGNLGQSYNGHKEDMSLRRTNSLATLLSMLTTTPPVSNTMARSKNLTWVDNMLLPSNFATEYFSRHFAHDADVKQRLTTDRQLTAKLQAHFLTAKQHLPINELARLNARAYVYSIRNYREEGWHGPWVLEDGVMQPNWVHIAACQRVILGNLAQRRIGDLGHPSPPLGAEATRGGSAKAVITGRRANPSGINKDGIEDWAGVEGVWRRLVSFMDYRDFHGVSGLFLVQFHSDLPYRVQRELISALCVAILTPLWQYHGQRTSGGLDTSILSVQPHTRTQPIPNTYVIL
jgi:hypothetical protein